MTLKTVVFLGIIPANTGKIEVTDAVPKQDRDHPREYGENSTSKVFPHSRGGSSPRIRGKCDGHVFGHDHHGIIPANTGKIDKSKAPNDDVRDHPREYGENSSRASMYVRHQGSSPRIRGKYKVRPSVELWPRIIPANTGKI